MRHFRPARERCEATTLAPQPEPMMTTSVESVAGVEADVKS